MMTRSKTARLRVRKEFQAPKITPFLKITKTVEACMSA